MKLFKISELNNQQECCWDNIYQKEEYPSFSRVKIGCADGEIPLILSFAKALGGSFGLLHVLLASRLGKESGRYQSPSPLSFDELEFFLYSHQEYFEQDGRHHLWLMSVDGAWQLIFDNHNYIYAYGDIDFFISELKDKGFQEGEIIIPVPHSHHYHVEFDEMEESVNNSFAWVYHPLEEGDDP